MKHLLATVSLLAATATPALADTSKANIKDHYKVVLEQTPYNVEAPVYLFESLECLSCRVYVERRALL